MSGLLRHAFLWGLLLSAYLTVAFVGLVWLNAEMWLGDYPADIREKFGEMSPKARRQRLWLGIPVLLGALGLVVLATVDYVRGTASPPSFLDGALHTFLLLMVFNVVDLLLVDWLFFVSIQPDFVVLSGTEGCEGYQGHRFHGYAFLKGTAGIGAVSALAGGIVALA